jgi:hypothetical protein
VVYCDNVSAVYLSTNPVQHQRTKHIEIDLHFVRERVALGEVRVLHVPTTSQYADNFTKGLPTSVFTEFRSSLNVRGPPSLDCGEVLDCNMASGPVHDAYIYIYICTLSNCNNTEKFPNHFLSPSNVDKRYKMGASWPFEERHGPHYPSSYSAKF